MASFPLRLLLLCLLFPSLGLWAQEGSNTHEPTLFLRPEILVGYTHPANKYFPKSTGQKGLFLSLLKSSSQSKSEWARSLHQPKTGFSLGFIDFGNSKDLGYAFSLMPTMELSLFQKKSDRWNVLYGYGGSYMNTVYDKENNPNNRAISTHLNWTFRSFISYDLVKRSPASWKIGIGYIHHSNGHTRLPNQGLNSYLLSLSADLNLKKSESDLNPLLSIGRQKERQGFFSFSASNGRNVLSEFFSERKDVYTLSVSTGRIYNGTFKLGVGAYYRFYEHYYDYIENGEALVMSLAPYFQKNAFGYASCLGFMASGEVMLDHVGIELGIGVNIYKPFYKLDWQLNEGFIYDEVFYPGELTWYYEFKRSISSRLGLKYYLLNNSRSPTNNFFIAAHLNANLGQADFSELSFGYVRNFKKKPRIFSCS
jgi:hypothetical protein